MTLASAAGFSLAMTVLAASPGPGVFGVISRSLSSGVKKTLFMIAGIVTGDLVYLIFAIFGLTYAAQNMGRLFQVIRILGGLYLVWIGLRTFFAPLSEGENRGGSDGTKTLSLYSSGLLITLSNPKVILFYCGFLPAFVDLGELTLREGGIIVMLVMVILSTVMFVYARLAALLGNVLRTPGGQRHLNRTAGGVMTAAGTLMIIKG